MKKYNVFVGNYGSGKTELSLNTAIMLSKKTNVTLADMDVVNPYFRSTDHKNLLKEHKIELISPNFANTGVDIPSLNATLSRAFLCECGVFDVGGETTGAKVMGGLSTRFANVRDQVCVYYVINARRPFQNTSAELLPVIMQTQANLRLDIDYFINNTNMGIESTFNDLVFGQKVVEELSSELKIPVAFASGTKANIKEFSKVYPNEKVFLIDIFTKLPWLD